MFLLALSVAAISLVMKKKVKWVLFRPLLKNMLLKTFIKAQQMLRSILKINKQTSLPLKWRYGCRKSFHNTFWAVLVKSWLSFPSSSQKRSTFTSTLCLWCHEQFLLISELPLTSPRSMVLQYSHFLGAYPCTFS